VIKYITLIIVICFYGSATSQDQFSLNQAIAYAYEHSNTMQISSLNILDAESQIDEFKSIGKPKVSAEIGYQYYLVRPQTVLQDFVSPAVFGILDELDQLPTGFQIPTPVSQEVSFVTNNNLNLGIDASWLLFDGSYLTGLEIAKLYRVLVAKEKDITKQEIRSNITKAYLGILIIEKNIAILKKNLTTAEKNLKEVIAFYENGFVEQLDARRIELSVGNLKTQITSLEYSIQGAYDVLKFQMEYPLSKEIILTEELESLVDKISIENLEIDETIDYSKRAEYANINLGQELNELNLKRTEKQKLPTVRAFASVSETLQRNNLFSSDEAGFLPTAVAGFSVNYNIYDGGNRSATEQRLAIEIEKTEIQKRAFERGVKLQVRSAKMNLLNAKSALDNAKNSLSITQEIYDKTLIKYKEGVGSSIEVTQAEASLYSAQSFYINAIYDLVIAKTELDIATGEL